MSDNQETNSIQNISVEDVFKRTRGDAAHSGVKAGLSVLPIVGEIFELLIAAPASKRLEAFLIDLGKDIEKLKEKDGDFSLEELQQNEVFQTTVIQAVQAAIRTHSKEKHEALRNVVLNSAISKTTDENQQAMFIRLCDELTDTHIHLLKFFETGRSSDLDLEDPDWRMHGSNLTNLVEEIEIACPELKDQFHFCIQIIDELHRKGLIANKLPSQDLAALYNSPTPTIFAREFLAFLKNPLE